MTRLLWNNTFTPEYETGVDQGVIRSKTNVYAPWNGLISVTEREDDSVDLTSAYEGVTYTNLKFGGFYSATIRAYSLPVGFHGILGQKSVVDGLILTGQGSDLFDFSYRSLQESNRYKIHIVTDATITSTTIENKTLSNGLEVVEYEWTVSAIPSKITSRRPTAHIVADTSRMTASAISELETILYGSVSVDPSWLTLQGFIDTVGP